VASNLCYVLGCYNGRADLSAIHGRFGIVATCHDHHPDNGGIGIGFGTAAGNLFTPPPPARQGGQGGSRVMPVVPPQPDRPRPTLPGTGGVVPLPDVAAKRLDAARDAARAAHSARRPAGPLVAPRPVVDLSDAF
jgi:hypothetical protein